MNLLPPFEAVEYSSHEAMMEALQSHARSCGYAISTYRYNARDQALYLKCDRGGEYKPRHELTSTNRLRDRSAQRDMRHPRAMRQHLFRCNYYDTRINFAAHIFLYTL